jgi:hypothetical protein
VYLFPRSFLFEENLRGFINSKDTVMKARIWFGKTGIYFKVGGKGRKGKTIAYYPFK